MVSRNGLLIWAIVATLLVFFLGAPVIAAGDDSTPPPTDPSRTLLADRYPPSSLNFYTAPGLKYMSARPVNNILSALFAVPAWLAKWTARSLDYAWNFNLARWAGGLIDPVNVRFGDLLWKFSGFLSALIGGWIAVRVFKGEMAQMTAGLMVLAMVLGIAVWSRAGISSVVADMEDAFSDLASEILVPGARPGETADKTITSISDGIYQQLVLENWSRANFTTFEAARKPEYVLDGLPGGVLLGVSDSEAEKIFKRFGGTSSPDFTPWYADGAIRSRFMVTFNTWLSVLMFVPILLVLAMVVIGAKALTVFFAMFFPVAVFLAAMPWFNGLRFLKGYAVLVFIAPVFKTLCSFALAIYMAFLGGLMNSAPTIPGGWMTITLIMAGLALTTYWFGKPIARVFSNLVLQVPSKAQAKQATAPAGAPTYRQRQQSNLPPPIKQLPIHDNSRRLRESAVKEVVAGTVERRQHHGQAVQQRGKNTDVPLLELLKEARRVVKTMAQAAANAEDRRR